MIEQFNFDIRLIFAILNGKVSAAINRKLSRNFRQNDLEITPEQWTVLIFLWEKDGVTQQELCNATFKDKPSMTRLIDNMERQHLVVRISDKKDRRTNLIHLTKDGKELEERARVIANQTLKEALQGITIEELTHLYPINPTTLKEVFKDVYGTSIAAHLKKHRMEKAAQLLRETDLPVAEVARQVGYESQSKFTAQFKRAYGLPPTEYRRLIRK